MNSVHEKLSEVFRCNVNTVCTCYYSSISSRHRLYQRSKSRVIGIHRSHPRIFQARIFSPRSAAKTHRAHRIIAGMYICIIILHLVAPIYIFYNNLFLFAYVCVCVYVLVWERFYFYLRYFKFLSCNVIGSLASPVSQCLLSKYLCRWRACASGIAYIWIVVYFARE